MKTVEQRTHKCSDKLYAWMNGEVAGTTNKTGADYVYKIVDILDDLGFVMDGCDNINKILKSFIKAFPEEQVLQDSFYLVNTELKKIKSAVKKDIDFYSRLNKAISKNPITKDIADDLKVTVDFILDRIDRLNNSILFRFMRIEPFKSYLTFLGVEAGADFYKSLIVCYTPYEFKKVFINPIMNYTDSAKITSDMFIESVNSEFYTDNKIKRGIKNISEKDSAFEAKLKYSYKLKNLRTDWEAAVRTNNIGEVVPVEMFRILKDTALRNIRVSCYIVIIADYMIGGLGDTYYLSGKNAAYNNQRNRLCVYIGDNELNEALSAFKERYPEDGYAVITMKIN